MRGPSMNSPLESLDNHALRTLSVRILLVEGLDWLHQLPQPTTHLSLTQWLLMHGILLDAAWCFTEANLLVPSLPVTMPLKKS